MDLTIHHSKQMKQFGPNSGLQLLFDFQQKEYCGVQQENAYYGAGLNVLIYDPQYIASFELSSMISLHPGYVFDITMRPVKSILKTERIGHCRSEVVSLFEYPVYHRHACFLSCTIEYAWRHCQCAFPSFNIKSLSEHFGGSNVKMPSCNDDLEKASCMKYVLTAYVNEGPNRFCPQCKRSCAERNYEYTISSKQFSQLTLNELVENYSIAHDVNDVKKNYALGNFYFQEMLETVIVEDFKVTALDLFIYVGGSLVLFIGISVVSLYEIVHQISHSTITLCQNIILEEKTDNKERIPSQTTSGKNAVKKPTRLSSPTKKTNDTQNNMSKNFRAAFKVEGNEKIFMKQISNNPATKPLTSSTKVEQFEVDTTRPSVAFNRCIDKITIVQKT